MGDALLDAGTARDALEDRLADLGFLGLFLHLGFELLGIAPQGLVGLLINRPLGGSAVPLLGMELAGGVHLGPAALDQFPDRVVGSGGAADLIVLQHEDVLGIVQDAGPDQGLANLDKGYPQPGVDALVDVEVVVRRDGCHLHGQLQIVL